MNHIGSNFRAITDDVVEMIKRDDRLILHDKLGCLCKRIIALAAVFDIFRRLKQRIKGRIAIATEVQCPCAAFLVRRRDDGTQDDVDSLS